VHAHRDSSSFSPSFPQTFRSAVNWLEARTLCRRIGKLVTVDDFRRASAAVCFLPVHMVFGLCTQLDGVQLLQEGWSKYF
jgi:hypothetical protein